jgi:hypothetical protein
MVSLERFRSLLLWAAALDVTRFENGYPTTDELVCSALGKERASNACAKCISHTISHVNTQPNIHLSLLQDTGPQKVNLQREESFCVWCDSRQCYGLLQKQTKCRTHGHFVADQPFWKKKPVTSSDSSAQQLRPRSFKTNILGVSLTNGAGVKFYERRFRVLYRF